MIWLLPLISAIFVFSLGIFVFLKNRKSDLNILFSLFCLSITIWLFGTFMMFISKSDKEAIFWDRFVYIGVVFVPVFMYHFSIIFSKIKGQRELLFLSYLLAFVFLILSRTDYFVKDLFRYKWGCHTVAQLFHHIFLIYFFSNMFGFFFNIYKYYRLTNNPVDKNQAKYVFLAFGVLLLMGSPAYLPAYKIPVSPFPFPAGAIFVSILGYAIFKYRLMDINIIVGKGIIYSAISLSFISIYLLFIFILNKFFPGFINLKYVVPSTLTLFFGMMFFVFILPKIKSGTEWLVFRNKYKYLDSLKKFSKELSFIVKEEELLEQTVRNISSIMGIPKVAILLKNERFGDYEIKADVGLDEEKGEKDKKIPSESKLVSWLIKNRMPFIRGEISKVISEKDIEEIDKDLFPLDVSICVPLIFRDGLVGILTLSEKNLKRVFSSWDFELIETLAKDLAMAISYKRLESRIRQADRLISLGTLAAGIAHEIRNPLSSVQTFLQLLPEKYNDEDFRNNFSRIVSKDVYRIEKIIESVLTLARFNMPKFFPVDINEVIEETLVLLDNDIKKNSVKVIKSFGDLPTIKGDKEQLKQVFLNIFLNGIQAMNNSNERILKITTLLKLDSVIQADINKKCVQIEITDNGHGIEKKFLSRIFDPFFTTKHTGTGLGLAIVHRIVEEHKGSIEVTSELNKGTTFYINLPVDLEEIKFYEQEEKLWN